MWNKSLHLIWIKLQIKNNRYFNFTIPFYILQELLDCVLDFTIVACLFAPAPAKSGSSSSLTVNAIKELVQTAMKFFDSLTEAEPFDLVDVTTGTVRVSIKVK